MKFLKTTLLTAIAAFALVFTACNREDSSSVDQSKIWLGHYWEYDGATGITTAKAQFRFSNGLGTILKLSDPANVKVNGEATTLENLSVTYLKTYTGVEDSATFVYTDVDNNVFTNTLVMNNAIDLPANINGANISKAAAYDIDFVGAPVAPGEMATVYIKEGNGSDWKAFSNSTQGATKVTLTIDQLAGLNTGNATIKIERYKAGTPASNPGKSGLTWVKYGSAVKNITLTN